jgi:hypothetical protein
MEYRIFSTSPEVGWQSGKPGHSSVCPAASSAQSRRPYRRKGHRLCTGTTSMHQSHNTRRQQQAAAAGGHEVRLAWVSTPKGILILVTSRARQSIKIIRASVHCRHPLPTSPSAWEAVLLDIANRRRSAAVVGGLQEIYLIFLLNAMHFVFFRLATASRIWKCTRGRGMGAAGSGDMVQVSSSVFVHDQRTSR